MKNLVLLFNRFCGGMLSVNFYTVFLVLFFSTAVFNECRADYRALVMNNEKKSVAGYIGSNFYSETVFLNPSVHRAAVKLEEFDMFLPLRDSENRTTYDEEKAKIRLFFKPGMRVWSASGRRPFLVGDRLWKQVSSSDAVKYSRNWKRNTNAVFTEVTARMSENKGEIVVEGTFTNKGRGECIVEFAPQFSFTRHSHLTLLIPRLYNDVIDGKQKSFFYGDKVVLDNTRGRNYFWRRAVRKSEQSNENNGFVDFVARERIPFTNSKINRVDLFGFVNLPGGSNLVWDLKNSAEKEELQYIEFGWENSLGEAIAAWQIKLKRNETRKVKFRVITVKGLSRFDALSENMLVGYGVEQDRLKIEMAPLKPFGTSILNGEVINSYNRQVMIKQQSELAEMQPFNAGKMEWRSTVMFVRNGSYPIKISLQTSDGKMILRSHGVIVP